MTNPEEPKQKKKSRYSRSDSLNSFSLTFQKQQGNDRGSIKLTIKARRYIVYLLAMIGFHIACLIIKVLLMIFFIVNRLYFQNNNSLILLSVLMGCSCLCLIGTLAITVKNFRSIRQKFTSLEKPFVAQSTKYLRGMIITLNFLFFFCSFGHSIRVYLKFNLVSFLVLEFIESVLQTGLLILVLYETAIGYDTPIVSELVKRAFIAHKDDFKPIPYF